MAQNYNKIKVFEFLEENKISYEKLEHDAVTTMEEMDAAGITSKGTVCKNLFLRNAKGNQHYLVTAMEEKVIDLKILAQDIGSTRLSFGSAERLMKHLGLTQGSVSPLGVLNNEDADVIVVFDRDLVGNPQVGLHPNDNTATIWMDFKDLQSIIKKHGNEIIFVKFTK